jgi:ATP-dependent Clp protease, protease subunit
MSSPAAIPTLYTHRVYVLGEIDEKAALEVINFIYTINSYDDLQETDKKDYQREPIKLIINSTGGVVYDSLAIVGAIEISKTEVHAIGLGAVMSSALDVFIACHKRTAHKMTRFMYHGIAGTREGKLPDQNIGMEEDKIIQELADVELILRTKLTKKRLDKVKSDKSDWYFSAKEALKFEIIEEII